MTSGQLSMHPFEFEGNPPLFILGSGFSHSVCPEIFPLANDLLPKAIKTDRLAKDSMLLSFLKEFFEVDPENQPDVLNFERIATFLLRNPFPAVGEHPLAHEFMFQELLGAISNVLGQRDLLNRISAENRKTIADFIARLKDKRGVILSLNQDLLLEAFLKDDEWDPINGYAMSFHLPFSDTPYQPRQGAPSLTLLKPHGSLNWGMLPEDFRDIAIAPLYLVEPNFAEPIHTVKFRGSYWEKYKFYPYIIPPIVGKAYEHRSIRRLWNIAREVLQFRSEIHVIGFSLSDSDVVMEYLFRSIGSTPTRINIVDPGLCEDMEDRFRSAFQVKRHGHELVPHKMDAVEYLKQILEER